MSFREVFAYSNKCKNYLTISKLFRSMKNDSYEFSSLGALNRVYIISNYKKIFVLNIVLETDVLFLNDLHT